MTQKQLDERDWQAILRARTSPDGNPKPGYKRNVEKIKAGLRESIDHVKAA